VDQLLVRESFCGLPKFVDSPLIAKVVTDLWPFLELRFVSHQGSNIETMRWAYLEVKEKVFRGGEPEPIIHHRVFGGRVEPIVRPFDIVEEDPTVLVLHDRLEFLLGGSLLDTFDGEVLFGRDVVLIFPHMGVTDVVVPASAPAPTPAPTRLPGRVSNPVPPATPASILNPIAEAAVVRRVEAMELLQSVLRDPSMEHSVVPNVSRPLSGLRASGIDEGRSAGPLVRELPCAGDGRVAARWQTVERCHR
jgi:hypothetical protein